MGGLSWWHWLIIIAAFVLLFGAKNSPTQPAVGRPLRILNPKSRRCTTTTFQHLHIQQARLPAVDNNTAARANQP